MWLKILGDKTVLVQLPGYDKCHIHFGLTHPTEGTVSFFLQLTDERHPEKSPGRRVELIRVSPLSVEQFTRWRDRLLSNLEPVAKCAVRAFLDSFSLKSFSHLKAAGWRTLPTLEELNQSGHARKGRIKLNDEAIRSFLEKSPETPSQMLIDPKEIGGEDCQAIAYRAKLKPQEVPELQNEVLKALTEAGSKSPWIAELLTEFSSWLRTNTANLVNEPIYLVSDARAFLGRLPGLVDLILEGAISSFDNQKIRAWLGKLKAELLLALRGEKEFDTMAVLGVDLKLLGSPKPLLDQNKLVKQPPSPWTEAQWSAGKAQAREIMIDVVRTTQVITYGDFVDQLTALDVNPGAPDYLRLKPHDPRLNQLLEEICVEDGPDLPMLTAVVVLSEGRVPGTGFYEAARRLGLQVGDPVEFWVKAHQRVLQRYGR